jgi:hypothetical protein
MGPLARLMRRPVPEFAEQLDPHHDVGDQRAGGQQRGDLGRQRVPMPDRGEDQMETERRCATPDCALRRSRFDFKIGSTRNAEVAYRFDEKPGHEPHVRIVDDHKTVLIDDAKEVSQFVGDMATSENLYLRIRALTAPRTSAEFTVAGAGPMIAAAYASCPLNPDIARRNASARASQKDDDD